MHVLIIQDKDKDQDNKKSHDLDIDEVKNHVGEKKKAHIWKKKNHMPYMWKINMEKKLHESYSCLKRNESCMKMYKA